MELTQDESNMLVAAKLESLAKAVVKYHTDYDHLIFELDRIVDIAKGAFPAHARSLGDKLPSPVK